MAFDIEGARKEGYSDAEIADALAARSKFDAAGAREAGYSDTDIIARLSDAPTVSKASAAAPSRDIGEKLANFGRNVTPQGPISGIIALMRLAGDAAKGNVDLQTDEGINKAIPTVVEGSVAAAPSARARPMPSAPKVEAPPAAPEAPAAPSALAQLVKEYAGPAAMDAALMAMGVPGPLMSAARYAVRAARKPEAEVAPPAAAERPAPAPEVAPEPAPAGPVAAPEPAPAAPVGPWRQFGQANGIADPAVAQLNVQSLLAKLAKSQKPAEPAAPPPEAPVDLGQFQNVLDQGSQMEGGIAALVKQLAQPQKLLSQRSPVQYMGAPEPQKLLPPPAKPTLPEVMPQLPAETAPAALPAPPRPPVEASVAPVAPPPPVKVTVRKPPLREAMKPTEDDPYGIPDFLDRTKSKPSLAQEKPPLAKTMEKVKQVAEDAAEDWVIEHDKAEMKPFEAANAIADKMEADGKTFRIGRQNLVGYVSRILKDKSEVAAKVAKATGIDELKLRKTLWGLKDRPAALAKIDQLVRINPKHEELIRSTLEPKVTKWWRQ